VIKNGMIGRKLGDFSITKVLGYEIAVSKALKAKHKKKKK
jgi:ribosomal protein S19